MTKDLAKRLLPALVPPLFRAVFFQLRSHGSLRFLGKTYTGVYGKFADVARAFPRTTDYHSQESEQVEIASMRDAKAALIKARNGEAPPALERFKFLCLLVLARDASQLNILDIGGGSGAAAAHLAFSCPGKDATVFITELPSIVKAGREVFTDIPSVRYIDDIDTVTRPLHIAFLGSSIQYIEDYKALLNRLAIIKPEMIAIADSPMGDAPTFVCAQVNMRHRVIPSLVINRNELIEHMRARGYRLEHRSTNQKAVNFDNYPAPYNSSASWNLVFKRSS